ncbi:hypothetical protein D9M68_775660 [compost metagenome]
MKIWNTLLKNIIIIKIIHKLKDKRCHGAALSIYNPYIAIEGQNVKIPATSIVFRYKFRNLFIKNILSEWQKMINVIFYLV